MADKKQSREYFQLSSDDKLVIKKLQLLTSAVEKVYPSIKVLLWRSFLQGFFVALGSTVGLSIVLALITYFFAQTMQIPFLEKIIPREQIQTVFPNIK